MNRVTPSSGAGAVTPDNRPTATMNVGDVAAVAAGSASVRPSFASYQAQIAYNGVGPDVVATPTRAGAPLPADHRGELVTVDLTDQQTWEQAPDHAQMRVISGAPAAPLTDSVAYGREPDGSRRRTWVVGAIVAAALVGVLTVMYLIRGDGVGASQPATSGSSLSPQVTDTGTSSDIVLSPTKAASTAPASVAPPRSVTSSVLVVAPPAATNPIKTSTSEGKPTSSPSVSSSPSPTMSVVPPPSSPPKSSTPLNPVPPIVSPSASSVLPQR